MYSYNKLIDLIYYPIRFKNLLNLKKKIIFYHIPRSGGTLIKFILKINYGKIFELNNFTEINSSILKENKIIVGHYEFTDLNNQNISPFTVIRNPNEMYNSYYRLFCKQNSNISKDRFINLVKNNNADNILTRIFSKKSRLTNFFFYKQNQKQIEDLKLNNDDSKLAYDNIKKISYFKFVEEFDQIINFINTDHLSDFDKMYKGVRTNIKNQKNLDFSELINLDEKIYFKLFPSKKIL